MKSRLPCVLTAGLAPAFCAVVIAAPPNAKKQPVTNEYHGTAVVDEYQWLEDPASAEVQAWSDAQNAHARVVLDALPSRDAVAARVTEILSAKTVTYFGPASRGGRLFVMKRQPPKQQPFLVVWSGADAKESERALVDPNTLDSTGGTAIDWFVPSPDGKLVAVSLSEHGSEAGDVHIFDVASGNQVFEVVERVNGGTAGGGLAWAPDGKSYFYTRYPRKGERPDADLHFYVQVYSHTLGAKPDTDRYEIGKDFPKIAEIELDVHEDSARVLASVQDGDGGKFAHFMRTPDGGWTQFTTFEDKIIQAEFGPGDTLFLLSRRGAPRGQILLTSASKPSWKDATVIVPEGRDSLVSSFMMEPTSILASKSHLFLTYQLGGPSELRVFDLKGNPAPAPKQLAVASIDGLTPLDDGSVLFGSASYLEPLAYYRYDAKAGSTSKTALAATAVVNFEDVDVAREFATSKDGTKVPVNILKPRGLKLDGSNPCMLYGYGGYGVSIDPSFSPSRKVLLEQGVIIAIANIRGGGEYGEQWHLEGNLTKKQNVFDDFAAVARHLIDRRYTSSQRLAIQGGSNGGLLMGAMLTQHPDLFRCIVSHVGIYDMLRVELSPNGEFNITEFGTVKDPHHFRALHAYSPYHRVKDGRKYPDLLMLTGANDPRVEPWHSRKFTARLQAASPQSVVLLRTSGDTGHGQGTPLKEQVAQSVDVHAFLFDRLGVKYTPAGR